MGNALKREFKKGQNVYVVDWWGTSNGSQAFETVAYILEVDEENETFVALLYGDTYKTYSFKDYGRLIFTDSNEAFKAAQKFPKPETVIYQLIGKRVYKKLVLGIEDKYTDGVIDLVICCNKGDDISSKEIGHSVFLNEVDAREKQKEIVRKDG